MRTEWPKDGAIRRINSDVSSVPSNKEDQTWSRYPAAVSLSMPMIADGNASCATLTRPGTHPALQLVHKSLSARRERLHEAASRRHEQTAQELKVVRNAEKDAVWSWWTVSEGGATSRRCSGVQNKAN